VVPSFYLTVKYLREVTPYFRKASVLADVGWELQTGFLGAQNGFLAGPTTPNTNTNKSTNSSNSVSSVESAGTAAAKEKERSTSSLINSPDTRSLTLLFCHLTRNYKCKGISLTQGPLLRRFDFLFSFMSDKDILFV
jgi:hypothetical protein